MKTLPALCISMVLISFAFTHKEKQAEATPIIFAVLDDGTNIEPIAKLEDGKLVQTVSGSDDGEVLKEFSDTYYQPKVSYSLMYGGKVNGKVTVEKSNVETECGATTAEVIVNSKVKLKKFEMALATSITPTKPAAGVRRAATPAEKAAIDKLVVKEFQKNKVAVKGMKMVKLTILDANNDKLNEAVGTYTLSPSTIERQLLFFIATKSKTGIWSIGFSETQYMRETDVMSGDIKDVDSGIYQEMLLDMLDIDNDGIAEIFTITQSFEGTGFYTYQWDGKKWSKIFEASNYHCAY